MTNKELQWIALGGKLKAIDDEALNDSDKTITVPAGKRWLVLSVNVELTATATVGNRQVRFDVERAMTHNLGGSGGTCVVTIYQK